MNVEYLTLVRDGPLDEARRFHEQGVGFVRDIRAHEPDAEAVTIVFQGKADHRHKGWQLAAVQELARELAPIRVNGIVGVHETAIAKVSAYLTDAPGITGQLLAVDGKGAGNSGI